MYLNLETVSLLQLSWHTTFPKANVVAKIQYRDLFCLPYLESIKISDLQFDGKKPAAFSSLPEPLG